MNIIMIVVLSLIGEAVWETLKLIKEQNKINFDRVGAIVVGLLLAVGARIDLMEIIGIPLHIPLLGLVLTGLLISRGANFIHDILKSIQNLMENSKG